MKTSFLSSVVLETFDVAPMTRRSATRSFVRDVADPEVADVQRYGGKASGLSRMMSAGVPAPPRL